MAMEYFCCYHSYREKLSGLSDEQVGRLFRAAMLYSETGEESELDALETIIFRFLKFDIDRAHSEYERRCAVNKANASKRRRSVTMDNDGSQNKDKDEDKDKYEYENKNESESKSKDESESREKDPHSPPNIYEVLAYKKEIGSESLATAFFDYYQANGWTSANGTPISDWRAAFRMWERREEKRE